MPPQEGAQNPHPGLPGPGGSRSWSLPVSWPCGGCPGGRGQEQSCGWVELRPVVAHKVGGGRWRCWGRLGV